MILDRVRHPIVLAPLAGGPGTPALAAAVSEAGGLGFLAAGYRSAAQLDADIREARARTAEPLGVNIFVPGHAPVDQDALRDYVERLRDEAARYGAEIGEPRDDDDDWDAKLAVLREQRLLVVSFTFGCPAPAVIAALHDAGSEVWVTVTDVAEARSAAEAGADALVLQGTEAGGHRGSFVDRDDAEAPARSSCSGSSAPSSTCRSSRPAGSLTGPRSPRCSRPARLQRRSAPRSCARTKPERTPRIGKRSRRGPRRPSRAPSPDDAHAGS